MLAMTLLAGLHLGCALAIARECPFVSLFWGYRKSLALLLKLGGICNSVVLGCIFYLEFGSLFNFYFDFTRNCSKLEFSKEFKHT
jgi:hypothetical protein